MFNHFLAKISRCTLLVDAAVRFKRNQALLIVAFILCTLPMMLNAQLLGDPVDYASAVLANTNFLTSPESASAKIVAPDGSLNSQFGSSVDIDGDTMVLGAPQQADEDAGHLGAAYVFTRIDGTWQFEAKLEPDLGQDDSRFGSAVAVSGNSIIVGAPGETVNSLTTAGAAYLFVRSEAGWTLQKKVFAFDVARPFLFGTSVDITGDIATVSDQGAVFSQPGAAYVFTRNGDTWSQEARLFDPNALASSQYGRGIALTSDTVVIGAPFAEGPNAFAGLALVFAKINGTWVLQQQLFADDGLDGDQFGAEVGISGDTIIVGAPRNKNGVNNHSGSAYVFTRDNGTWTLQQKLFYSGSDAGFGFGFSVAISDDHVIVGDNQASTHGISSAGAASVYVRTGTQWNLQNRLSASDGAANDQFGCDVSIQGTEFVVGAPLADIGANAAQGAAYYFVQSPFAPDLEDTFDSGTSNADNITKSQDLTFDVGGITPGSTVELLRDGVVVDSKLVAGSFATMSDETPANGTFKYTTRQIVAGETSSQSEFLVVTVDTTAPTVTINQSLLQSDPTHLQPIKFDIKFNEAIVGFDQGHISLAASTAGVEAATVAITGSGANLLASVSNISTDGTVSATVTAGAAQDLAGNTSLSSTSSDNSIILDTTPPTVTVNQAAGQADPTSQLPIHYTVMFSEPIINFSAGVVTFRLGGVDKTGTPALVTGGPTIYDLAITNFVSDNKIASVVVDANRITDLAGNGNLASTSTDNTITVDNTGPSVTINLASGQIDPTGILPVNFAVQFSEPVTGFTLADLSYSGSTVNTGNASAVITGSGSSYNVAVSNVTRGGTLKVSVVAGAVRDAFGNLSLASTSTDNTINLDYVTDSGFEFTNTSGVNPYWSSTSTRFGTSLCTVGTCGTGNGTATPRSGNGWIWFDGSDQTTAENATASQNVTFPTGGLATLNYYLRVGAVSAPSTSTLQIKIDGNVLQTISEPKAAEAAYTLRTVDVSAYTDGASHLLSFEYSRPEGATFDNFTIDDVSLSVTQAVTPKQKAPFDFDGDGKTDLSVFRPQGPSGAAEWWYRRSSNGTVNGLQFGISTDTPVAADFTGDGKTDVAVWRPSSGQWYVLRSEDFSFYSFPFGTNGDIPVPADFDADGRADAAVFRPSTGTWFIQKTTGGTDIIPFARNGDIPVVADYDGDGKADIAIFRPSGASPGAAEWWIRRSSGAGVLAFQFGISTDKAIPGDYTGDGKTDVAIYRPGAPATWYVLRSEDFSFFSFPFGTTGDIPVQGNYDGDAKWDAGVFRPSNKTWFVNQTGGGGTLIIPFGVSTDVPLPSTHVGN